MIQTLQRIQAYTTGMSEAEFMADAKTTAACEHELAALGESSKLVGHETQRLIRGVRWSHLRLMRNMLVHEHYQVNPRTVWHTLQRDLPPIRQALEDYLERYNDARGHLG